MALGRVLVVDDQIAVADALAAMVTEMGYQSMVAHDVDEALELFEVSAPDLVLSDVKMGRQSGLDLLRRVRERGSITPVVLITGEASVDRAIRAVGAGAADYLPKPVNPEALQRVLEKLAMPGTSTSDLLLPHAEDLDGAPNGTEEEEFVGSTPGIITAFTTVARVATEDMPVLVVGENGTGKELVAKRIHECSRRASGPFVPVNVAGLNANLAESEFFGHVRGAFTDARSRHAGLFEQAHGGTLFLDEIGDLDLGLQAKILRALQEPRIKPVGGSEEIEIDVRLVSATNRDLPAWIREGRFREDLYFRINVVTIPLPPLRERSSDIIPLARAFIRRYAGRNHTTTPVLTREAAAKLLRYHWPGNVRELQGAIRAALPHATGGLLTPGMFPLGAGPAPGRRAAVVDSREFRVSGQPPLRDVARGYVQHVLGATAGNVTRAAEILGVSRRTLQRWQLGGADIAPD